MSVGSIGSSAALSSLLQARGLTADKIDIVEDDLELAQQAGPSSTLVSVNGANVRSALDKQISDDVASGKLSKDDAAKISEALDQLDGKSAGASSGSAAPAAGRPAGGGGGGASTEEKTELSRVVTVSGGVKTTVITYTDGTSETETSVAMQDDTKPSSVKSGKDGKTDRPSGPGSQGKSDAASDQTMQDYLSQIEPGSLLEAYA